MSLLTLSLYDASILSMGALFLGIIMLIKGGNWSIDAAIYVAQRYGISPMVVGFTVIALGASLPEPSTSIIAARKKQTGMVIGNIIGSKY